MRAGLAQEARSAWQRTAIKRQAVATHAGALSGQNAAMFTHGDFSRAVLGLLVGALCAPAHAEFRALAALERSGALVTAAAVDLTDNRLVAQLHGNSRLTPASLTKLTTAAAALDAWSADKMFETRLLSAAPLVGAALDGDLILQGAGDPSLDDRALWALAAQLRGAGVESVRGRLIASPAPFGVVACETKDRCDALRRSDRAYDAPLASIGVDFGTWCIAVRPTLPGAPALVRGCGVTRLPVPVEGVIKTVSDGARQTYWVERVTTAAGDSLRVGGDVPTGSGQQVYRSMSDPAHGVGLLLEETLHELGIRVAGPIVVDASPPPASARVLAQVEGLSLREQLGRMLRFSNNYIADVLTLDLAASAAGAPPVQLSAAGSILSAFVGGLHRIGELSGPPAPPLYSGSGLTRENQLSANDLVTLLAHQYHDTRRFPAFYGGLVVPRDAPFSFLRTGSDAWLDRVALKTGTMEMPSSVCGIAGYMRKRDGGWIAFAAIVNGSPSAPHVPLEQALEAERTDLEELLSRY
jgi:D-alanyl-D-alanine carboxypeptidase/D-alanyl-D-alanine-endopeptidase (penicillin-binding protein 4)